MKPASTRTALEMSEAEFQRLVIQTAQLYGWLVFHARSTRISQADGTVRHATAMAGQAGFPDLVLSRGGRLMFLELKVGRNRPKPNQVAWLNSLSGLDCSAAFWVSFDVFPSECCSVSQMVAVVYPRHWDWLLAMLRGADFHADELELDVPK